MKCQTNEFLFQHRTAVVGHRLFVHGGHDGIKWLDDLYVLDTENLTWMEVVVNGKVR